MQLIKTYSIAMAVTLMAVFAMRPDAPPAISPLEPVETMSPRATLIGFIECVNKRYAIGLGPKGMLSHYLDSGRLYADETEENGLREMYATRLLPANFMDLSRIPDASKMETTWRLSSQLKEILDRLPIPPSAAIPDAAMMEAEGKQSWRIPGTEIIIERINSGPRLGDYLFSAETVSKIPAFYAAIKDMPYRETATPDFYNYTFHYPSGLAMFFRHIIPVRWFMTLPAWTQSLVADQPVWRWVTIIVLMGLFLGITQTSRYFARRLSGPDRDQDPTWELLPFVTLVVITPSFSWFFSEVMRVSGIIYTSFNVFFWGTFFIALTWLVWKGGQILAEAIIAGNEMKAVSIDSQIIRLSFRLLSLILSLALMTEGANRLGMPAYSILTGLGIGGLAVALAAQHTLANLLGSLIIMFEKPFRVGHWIKAGTVEGVIEDVGFRSTRIRTHQNSVVSVPSSDLVNQSIENMTTRRFRVARRQIFFSLKTPIDKIEALMQDIRDIIHAGGHDDQHFAEVILKSISSKGYEIMFDFKVRAHNEAEELKEQQRILLAIAHEAERDGIQFSRYGDWLDLSQGAEVATQHHGDEKPPESHPEPSAHEE
jgi:MscS family membrane protein